MIIYQNTHYVTFEEARTIVRQWSRKESTQDTNGDLVVDHWTGREVRVSPLFISGMNRNGWGNGWYFDRSEVVRKIR